MEPGEAPLAQTPLAELLEQVAARRPAPAAGTAAAVSCALAAALARMCAAHDPAVTGTAAEVRAGALCERALELAERELTAYQPVLEAARLPESDPDRTERLRRALAGAAASPLAIASAAAQVAGIASGCVDTIAEPLLGDALAAVELADGACRAAARLVEVNLAALPGDPRLTEVAGLVRTAAEARAEALAKASGQ